MKKISTESYKGVRDFYPEDMSVQNFIFKKMRETAESFGYSEYSASILEPTELYQAKSGEELVSEQTYSFKDRGDRDVTLRPEMTPTLARMVAGKKRELSFPLRWYSIPNIFRYEQPQRGRLREHWQLNVDIFGVESNEAEKEMLSLAHSLMKNFGAKESDFVIKINDRRIMNALYEKYKLTEEEVVQVSKALDKKSKNPIEVFKATLEGIFKINKHVEEFLETIESNQKLIKTLGEDNPLVKNLMDLIDGLASVGVTNVLFDSTIVRGLDYYTGIVFEIFDTDPKNKRALFGGGRYDDLLSIFGNEKVSAVGFGAGDVTIKDFLETHGLLPAYTSTTNLYLGVIDDAFPTAQTLADSLRAIGVNVAVDYTGKNVGDQIKKATNDHIPFLAIIGKKEIDSKKLKIKNLATREELEFGFDEIEKIAKMLV
ncbi:histidine--tRNA ligase [Candidatus Parcubacteria bacterium]|nr:histidine--tRNA ligase [Candidatus Parcubacteria bacterium]